MAGTYFSRRLSGADIVLRVAIVAMALGTAYIHLTLGGQLFTLNAIGYMVGAAAMVAPIAIAVRYRWLIRIALAGYASTTIGAWLVQPTYFSTAYLAKAIELTLVALLAIDFVRRDGNPIERIREAIRSLARPRGPASGHA
jgi:hypothetical protein